LHPKYATGEWGRTCGQSIFYGAEALGLHSTRSWDCLNKHVAHGAALALGLHHTVTPGIAANELGWRNAQHRIQLADIRLLWELHHTAPQGLSDLPRQFRPRLYQLARRQQDLFAVVPRRPHTAA
jgi:hypothetical protein